MTASVVALSVQAGSGGFAVARQVAERLQFRYYDWEITSEAAALAGVSPNDVIAAERLPNFIERMMMRLGSVSTVGVEAGVYSEPSAAMWSNVMQNLTSDDYRQFIERVVLELAARGEAVLVGHAAQYTLRDRPGVLRVLLRGSLKNRSERLASEQGIDIERASQTVKQSDHDRSELMRRLYKFDWLDASMYDMTLSSDQIPLETVTDLICEAAKSVP
jgi:cytidylate kinase